MNISTWILISLLFIILKSSNSNGLEFKYKDGTFTGESQATYIYEPYVGKATVKVYNHKIVKVEFQIVDTIQSEVFKSDYDKHFPDNELYQKQCHNDWKGVQLYPVELIKKQDIDSVDAISGATWSYNIFKASVKKALNE